MLLGSRRAGLMCAWVLRGRGRLLPPILTYGNRLPVDSDGLGEWLLLLRRDLILLLLLWRWLILLPLLW